MNIRTPRHIARSASIFAAAALVAASAVPAHAGASDPTGTAKSAKREAAKSDAATDKRRYCSVTKTTGSLLERKTCKTRSEWIAITGVDPAHR